ncbi:RNA-directed DNA polymerase, eukaryota, reverse transcriptase zinc-binding domain protein [Tanacetum coccineum]
MTKKKKKTRVLIFKEDFEKAFDSISWNYLDHILDSLRFGLKWRSWIKTCLSYSRASILVNGSPTFEFSINRDLRQGDPLSPFLFILVMEGLHNAFVDAFIMPLLILVEGNWTSIHTHCFMINVYAPQEDKKKETLWHNILDFKDRNPGHYFIFGDFNVVRYASERIGTIFNPTSTNVFNKFIRDAHLRDIPIGGHLFTRINKRGDKLSKLDHFLITERSTSLLYNFSAQVLDCHISDHRPILLSPSSSDFGPIPFKFYNSWLLDKHLQAIVSRSSNRITSQTRDKEDLIKKIKDFDDNIANGTGDVMVDSQRSTWLENLRSIELKENLDLSQKAKIKWGIEADENSKFFHAIVNQKRRYLSIHGIKYEGHWLTDPLRIKDALFTFYETKFQRVDVVKIASRSPFYKSLNEDQNSYLDTIKEDVVGSVQHFFNTSILPRGCNTSFIALIPKVPNPMMVSDFRPISLIRAHNKIIAKILDGPLMVNEVIQWSKRKKAKLMVFKIDFEKAFDSILGFLIPATSSILINGRPTREFNIHRGLRQGDPLSPFLFIIAMEGLHVAVEDAMAAGLYRVGILISLISFSKRLSKWKASLLSIGVNKKLESISNNSEFPIKCHEKFRILKAKIRQWNNNNKTMETNRKASVLEELSSIEKKIDEGSASPSDTENRLNILLELEIINKFASMDLI